MATGKAAKEPSRYSYTPIGPKDIRLLTILPSEDRHAHIKCRITSCRRRRAHAYEAISYTWGDPTPVQAIQCDGVDLPITFNCYAALIDIRDRLTERVVWIDAVCIDQTNIQERNDQVAQMGEIYSRARRTIVYLGPHNEFSEALFHEMKLDESPMIDYDTSLNATRFFGRTWFWRIWVIQEVALAQKCTALIGEREIPFRELAKFAASCSGYAKHTVIKASRFAHENGVRAWKRGSTHQRHRDLALLEMFEMTGNFQCSDDRDRLFAILPLIYEKAPSILVAPDYNKSVVQVFADLSWYLLNTEHYERVLPMAMGCQGSINGCPSWAICLGAIGPFKGRVYDRTLAAMPRSQAGLGNMHLDMKLERLALGIISLRGLIVDTFATACSFDAAIAHFVAAQFLSHSDEVHAYTGLGVSGAAILSRLELEPGDVICVILGFKIPFVLRRCSDIDWQLVCECAHSAVMDGNVVASITKEQAQAKEPIAPLIDFTIS